LALNLLVFFWPVKTSLIHLNEQDNYLLIHLGY